MNSDEKIVSSAYIRRKTLLAFLFFFIFIFACVASWKWLQHQPKEQGALKPLRAGLNFNESFFTNIFSANHLAKAYPVSAVAPKIRVNGDAGMGDDFDPATWQLHVVKAPGDTLLISLDDLKALPKTDVIFDFKCIEGWSQVTHWAGVKFSDFAKHYGLDEDVKMKYTSLETPDDAYYVGIDNLSMMQPQTILCYEMNGAPLPFNQGAPLRLIIPVKYGIKHLKRIGMISFSDTRPKDYWYERGYDYYSGL
jgi:hypothetical protein